MTTYLKRAEEFAGRLSELYGDSLLSVGLYGSAARGDYREGASDLNVLVILRELGPAELRRGSAVARAWVEAGNPPPLMFSEAEWSSSADAFPIEYSDIETAHIVLHGSDPFSEVRVRWEHLRLLCEHELKAKKIALREHYLLSAESPEELGSLLAGSVSTFVALFRAGLRLSGDDVPRTAEKVVAAVAERAGFDPAPVHRALRARAGAETLRLQADDPIVVGYLDAVARAGDWLDGLTRAPAPAPS